MHDCITGPEELRNCPTDSQQLAKASLKRTWHSTNLTLQVSARGADVGLQAAQVVRVEEACKWRCRKRSPVQCSAKQPCNRWLALPWQLAARQADVRRSTNWHTLSKSIQTACLSERGRPVLQGRAAAGPRAMHACSPPSCTCQWWSKGKLKGLSCVLISSQTADVSTLHADAQRSSAGPWLGRSLRTEQPVLMQPALHPLKGALPTTNNNKCSAASPGVAVGAAERDDFCAQHRREAHEGTQVPADVVDQRVQLETRARAIAPAGCSGPGRRLTTAPTASPTADQCVEHGCSVDSQSRAKPWPGLCREHTSEVVVDTEGSMHINSVSCQIWWTLSQCQMQSTLAWTRSNCRAGRSHRLQFQACTLGVSQYAMLLMCARLMASSTLRPLCVRLPPRRRSSCRAPSHDQHPAHSCLLSNITIVMISTSCHAVLPHLATEHNACRDSSPQMH